MLQNQDDFKRFMKYLNEDLRMPMTSISRNFGINKVTLYKIQRDEMHVTERSLRLANGFLDKLRANFYVTEGERERDRFYRHNMSWRPSATDLENVEMIEIIEGLCKITYKDGILITDIDIKLVKNGASVTCYRKGLWARDGHE